MVDAEAAVAGPFARLLREPVVLVVVLQEFLEGATEHVDAGDFDLAVLQPEEVGEEGGRGLDLHRVDSSSDGGVEGGRVSHNQQIRRGDFHNTH